MDSTVVLTDLRKRLISGTPLFWLETWEEERWHNLLGQMTKQAGWSLIGWSPARGLERGSTLIPADASFHVLITEIHKMRPNSVVLMKDAHLAFADPLIARFMRDFVPILREQKKAIFLMSADTKTPFELQRDLIRIKLPLPDYQELQGALSDALARDEVRSHTNPTLTEQDLDRLVVAALGLTEQEAVRGWLRVLQGRLEFDDQCLSEMIAEKKRLAAGSNLVEFYDLDEGAADVGGLDVLKSWLQERSAAYSPAAREQGVPLPRGVLLLGVQGCGKSLTARASARILGFPLIRADLTNIISGGRGESEQNLREVLKMAEALSPSVLWLDEIEKGFAGGEGDDATLARLMGTFLTWMSEQRHSVFVVATANSVQHLPSELIRKGRFDELFFVDLPNYYERLQILSIHLKKRGWKTDVFPLATLAETTEGFNGAELEQIVSSAIVSAFAERRPVTEADLTKARDEIVPLSVTMEDKVFTLREWAKDRCRRATSDSRVNQMLEAEGRGGRLANQARAAVAEGTKPRWLQMAETGQVKSALTELVKSSGHILLPEVQKLFEVVMPTRGDRGLVLKDQPHTILWHDLSNELSTLIAELIAGRRLYVVQSNAAEFERSGYQSPLPALTQYTAAAPARPSWLPTALRTSPDQHLAREFSRVSRVQLARSK